MTWDAPAPRAALIDVRDEVGAAALCFVVERSGRRRTAHADGGTWTVADRLDPRRHIDVFVCGPTPVDAEAAVQAFAVGIVRAVICVDQPSQILHALDALDNGLSLVPTVVLERARAVPAITERQRAVLGGVLAGQSNIEIAHALQVRPVTIKREVAVLFAGFGAARRFELMGVAFGLGYHSRPVRP